MTKKTAINKGEVKHVADLANLKLSDEKIELLSSQLTEVLDYSSKIQKLDLQDVSETSQVTNLTNVFRDDEIDKERMLTQEDALKNAKRKYQGFFVVESLFK
jgi:aspartyl-tRNA(Asn)/glutamyl-tRNA(Gln) amidotransferase subunit C